MKQAKRKAETKRRLQNAASKAFKSKGFYGVGVDGLSKQAEATSGAFYAHLGSKKEAFIDVLARGLDDVKNTVPKYQSEFGEHWPQKFADYYLGQAHVNDLECGCAMTALSPDVARGDDEEKKLFELKMESIVELIAEGIHEAPSSEDERARAWAFLSTLVGGVTLARSVKSPLLAKNIAESAKAAAVAWLLEK